MAASPLANFPSQGKRDAWAKHFDTGALQTGAVSMAMTCCLVHC